jgi:hypothetical protein
MGPAGRGPAFLWLGKCIAALHAGPPDLGASSKTSRCVRYRSGQRRVHLPVLRRCPRSGLADTFASSRQTFYVIQPRAAGWRVMDVESPVMSSHFPHLGALMAAPPLAPNDASKWWLVALWPRGRGKFGRRNRSTSERLMVRRSSDHHPPLIQPGSTAQEWRCSHWGREYAPRSGGGVNILKTRERQGAQRAAEACRGHRRHRMTRRTGGCGCLVDAA